MPTIINDVFNLMLSHVQFLRAALFTKNYTNWMYCSFYCVM